MHPAVDNPVHGSVSDVGRAVLGPCSFSARSVNLLFFGTKTKHPVEQFPIYVYSLGRHSPTEGINTDRGGPERGGTARNGSARI